MPLGSGALAGSTLPLLRTAAREFVTRDFPAIQTAADFVSPPNFRQ